MKTLIRALFSNKRKAVKRLSRALSGSLEANQLIKMARLGQTLVVMSR
ncbi:MAG TPA: hypothetical protein VI791_00900 [Patescibacteria group bacterium]|nr:hypothetical protein [Patescibacteria group bacterium]